jgi:uncharacterized protein
MKIAIVSDIHDNVWTLKAALAQVNDAAVLLFCGDLCSPFIVGLMAEVFRGPIHIVEGNNEGDWRRISQAAAKFSNVHLHGEFFEDEMDGKRVAINHYPNLALPLAQSGQYDLVCYGHDHHFAIEQRGSTLTLNPGALLGYDPVLKQDIPATFIIYDTQLHQAAGYQVLTKMTAESTAQSRVSYP